MIRQIFHGNAKWISLTYFVMVVENIIFASYPYFLGRTIDSLAEGEKGFLFFYVSIFMVGISIGLSRRMFDTRIFAKIWNRIAVETIESMMSKNIDSSKMITRAGLTTRFVDFFEYHIPNAIRNIVYVSISTLALAKVLGLNTIFLILAYLFLVFVHNKISLKSKKIDFVIQDSYDEGNHAIGCGNRDGVVSAYDKRTSNYIRHSDLHAFRWTIDDIMGIVFEIVILLSLVSSNVLPGTIIASVSYVWMAFNGISGIGLFQGTLREIEVAEEKLKECL